MDCIYSSGRASTALPKFTKDFLSGFEPQGRNRQTQVRFDSYDSFDIKVQAIQKLMVHFRRLAFRLHSVDGDALGLLAGRGLGISDGQNPILHRRLDILGLQTRTQVCQDQLSHNTERKSVAYLGAIGQPDSPNEPAGPALLEGVAMLLLLRRLRDFARDGKVSVLNVNVDIVLGETRQLERRGHLVLVGVFVQVHPVSQAVSNRALEPRMWYAR